MSSRPTFIGAVEIGTSKITVLVGEYSGRELAIIGRGECSARGVIKGAVVDFKAASDCTHAALQQAERDAGESIDRVFLEAGFEWRDASCSMCGGSNGDMLQPGERSASTTNRNFEGRQGPGALTHIMSPAMAAAAAITGHLTDVRELVS